MQWKSSLFQHQIIFVLCRILPNVTYSALNMHRTQKKQSILFIVKAQLVYCKSNLVTHHSIIVQHQISPNVTCSAPNRHQTHKIRCWSMLPNVTEVHQSTSPNLTEVGRSFLGIPRRSWHTLVLTQSHLLSTTKILFSTESHLFSTKHQKQSQIK